MTHDRPHSSSALLKQNLNSSYPLVAYGKGVFLYDDTGRRYLDGSSGAMTASVGHGVEEIAQAMARQAERVAFVYRTQFSNEPAEELARRLTSFAPGDLNTAFFDNSGSEATEYAIRASVNHWRELGKPTKVKVLSRETSYHGMTMGALSLSGHAARRPDYGSLLHPFPVTAPAYAYRNTAPEESERQYAERAVAEFEQAILDQGIDTVAAVIAEPIVAAAGGVLVAPEGYFRLLREMCDRLDILLILDEVVTGGGRVGEWFACVSDGVVPDLLVVGKGISGGYAPVAGVLMRDHLVDAIRAGSGVSAFGHTFSNNPLGAATCLAVLDLMERDDVLANVRDRGAQLVAGLRELAVRYPIVADVRGRGLLWGFEFVTDQESKSPPAAHRNTTGVFTDECFARGLIVYPAGIAPLNNAVVISPPLVIDESEMTLLLESLDGALAAMTSHIRQWDDTTNRRS